MTDNELLAKNVFGELTLEDVYRRFEGDLVAMYLENNVGIPELLVTSWIVEGRQFIAYGDYETNFIFNLNAKVKVLDSHIELKDEEGTEWYLTFLVSANLENLSPKGPRS